MKLHFSIVACFVAIFLSAQSALLSINGKEISTEQFLRENSNNLKWLGTEKALDSYIQYELLQHYAIQNGIENYPEYQKKYNLALKALKDSLYLPISVTEPIYRKAFQNFSLEKKVTAIHFDKEADAQKVKQFWDKNKHLSLEAIQAKFVIKPENCNTNFVLPFYLNDSIEQKVYKLKINEISEVFSFGNGFHILRLDSERSYLGEVLFGVISLPKSEENKALIDAIYQQLQKKEKPFQELAKEYSKNELSDEYGTMPKINSDIPEEIYQQLAIINIDEYSKPFEYEGSYNIVKLYDRKPMSNYNSSRKTIASLFSGTQKSRELEEAHIQNVVANSPHIKMDKNLRANVIDAMLDEKQLDKEIFNIYEDKLTVRQLRDSLLKLNPDLSQFKKNPKAVDFYIENVYQAKATYFYHTNAFFWQKDIKPIVDSLKKAYRIIYAFEKIHGDALVDEAGMKAFLHEKQSQYMWEKRAEGVLYYCLNEDIANEVHKLVKKKKSYDEIMALYKDKVNENKQVLVFAVKGKFTSTNKEFPKAAKFQKGIQKVTQNQHVVVMNIDTILPEQPMELEEIRNQISPMYLELYYLKTMNELRKNAAISINENEKQKIVQSFGK